MSGLGASGLEPVRAAENLQLQVVVSDGPDDLLNALAVHGPAGEVAELAEVGAGLQDDVEGLKSEVRCFIYVETLKSDPPC